MENDQKAIMIGVGLFITIIIIAAVMLITGLGQNLLNKGTQQVEGISESLVNELTAQYNGKTLDASAARMAAVQLVKRPENITVKIAGATVTTPTDVNSKIDSTKSYKVSVTGGGDTATVSFAAI